MSVPEIWKELYDTDPPKELRPMFRVLTAWADRKYGKKIKECKKEINKLRKQCEKANTKQSSPPKKTPIIVKQNTGTIIVARYRNGYLIHGSGTFNIRDTLRKHTTYFCKHKYNGFIIDHKLKVEERHVLMAEIQKVFSGSLVADAKSIDLELRERSIEI